jgi:phage tail-like protein
MASNTRYMTVVAKRRVPTALARRSRRDANGTSPAVASAREYLRKGLPAVFQENDFGVRFVGALETVLDPVVAMLDSLPAHVTPELAPEDLLDLLAQWLGLEPEESWPLERRRELVRRAGDLGRRHGTKAGLEATLRIVFPEHPLRVEDSGKVTWSTDDAETKPSEKPAAGFIVYCDAPLDEQELAAVSRLIEQVKPVNVPYKLRVKAPPRRAS